MAGRNAKVRGEAERAALELLRSRAALIGEATTIQQERDQLAARLADVDARYASAYTAARDGGWTVPELEQLGLTPPVGDTGRRRARHGQPRPDAAQT